MAAASSSRPRDAVTPTIGARFAGLTKQGKPSWRRQAAPPRRGRAAIRGADPAVDNHIGTRGPEKTSFSPPSVHAVARVEDTRAVYGRPASRKSPWDGSVLAPGGRGSRDQPHVEALAEESGQAIGALIRARARSWQKITAAALVGQLALVWACRTTLGQSELAASRPRGGRGGARRGGSPPTSQRPRSLAMRGHEVRARGPPGRWRQLPRGAREGALVLPRSSADTTPTRSRLSAMISLYQSPALPTPRFDARGQGTSARRATAPGAEGARRSSFSAPAAVGR